MRKLLYLIVLLYSSFIVAQNNGITYQAVIYHPNGQNIPGQNIQNTPMANKLICLQFSLIDDQSQVEYKETIQTTTDAFGMVNLLIGSGTQTGGYATTFETVDWTTQTKSLKVELDTRGTCQEFIALSDNPLSTVPYAFSAQTANAISGIVAIENGGTGAANATEARTNLGLGNVDNTSDLNKPISTATQIALNTKEDLLNKSTNVSTDGTSDIKYPSAKAVKDYVDGSIAIATIPDATTTVKGKIKLSGDLGGTADLPTVPGLANKENTANKSAVTTLGNSDVLFPTQNAVKTYVDTNITAVNNANSALQATVTANATASATAIAAVQADVDANEATSSAADTALQNNISTLQNTVTANATNTTAALAQKEDAANKSTATSLGTSNVLFPTQNAVKTYVDTQVAAATIPDATTTLKGKIQLAGDLSGTAAAPTVPGLATKENTANKSTATSLGTSDVLFPTQNAVKTYVDTQVAAATIPDATTTLKGKIQLAGDLSGTANAPTVPALATKENTANKSTTTALGTSDVLFPTQNAVKTYVDTNITAVNNANSVLQATVTANATASTTAIAAVQADVDANEATSVAADTALQNNITTLQNTVATNATNTTAALALKEDAANKSTATALGTSDVLFPTQNAVKTYVDAQVASATIADADAVTKGKIQLAGDLTGTAASPTVATGAITTAKLAADAVTSAKILDGTIVVGDLADDAVETAKIKNANVTNAKLDKTNIPLSGFGAATADVALGSNKLTGVADPTAAQDAATKSYVDSQISTGVVDATTTVKGKVQLAGDLTGTAASPTVATGAITTAKLAADAVTSAKITDGTIVVGDLADDAVETTKIKDANVTDAKLDKANIPLSGFGAATADVDLGSNKLTNVTDPTAAQDAATKSYVDSTITSNATPDATTTVKGKVQLAGDLTGTAASPTVATGAITTAKLAADAVTSAKITDGTIVVSDLANNAVETAKIKDANVTNAKLDKANIPLSGFGAATADVDLGSNKLTNVTDPASAQDAATKNYVDTATSSITTLTDGKIYVGNASNEATQVTPTGDVTITNAGVTAIGTGKVVTAMLADTAVTTAKITDANVTTAKLANDAVETAKIKNANVTNAKLDKANIPLSGFGAATADVDLGSNKLTNVTDPASAQDAATKSYVDSTITSNATPDATTTVKGKVQLAGDLTGTAASPTVATGAITTAKLAADAVTSAKITDGTIVVSDLANNAVETAKIKDANVTNAKLDKANIPLSGFGAATADVDLGSNKLTNVTDPASAQDAATKNYVDTATSSITTLTDGKIYVGNASNEATQVTPTGDVTITNAGVTAIGTGKVVTAMLADTAVTTAKITDANVTTAKLANDAVETAKIKNANVTNAKLDKANIPLSGFGAATADVDLGSNKLTNVTDPASAQDAATKNYVDTATSSITTLTDGKIYVGNASNEATQLTPTGDVTITNAGVTAIGTGKVVTAMLADTAVTTAKITDANVTTAKLADNAVETAKIKNAAVTTAKIADANVTYAKIQNVSATDKVLGRVSTGAGVIEEIATTGSGDVVRATSPTLVTPNLGTPSAIDLTNATGLPIDTAVTGILDVANGGTGSATQNFVDLSTNQTIAGVKTFSGTSTVVNQNLTVNAAGTTGQGIILSDDGDIVDNNDGAATFRFTGGVKINNGNKSAGTTTNITLSNTGNITASGSVTASQITSNVATGTAPLVVTSTTPVANLSIGGNAATATKLAATKNINGVAFDGSTDITVATAANTLTGTTLASNVVNSSLTSVGTITAGTWNGTTIAIANGGTGQTTKASAFDALSPMTTTGDIIYGGASGTGTRLAKGTDGQVLVLASGVPKWSNNIGGGVLSKSASYTMLDTDNANYVVFSGSTASQTITLPSAVTAGAGREITIKSIASVSVTINATAGKLISDSTTTTATSLTIGIEPSNNWIKAISDGTNWIILRALF